MTPRDWVAMAALGLLAVLFAAALFVAWRENRALGGELEDALAAAEDERAGRYRAEGIVAWLGRRAA